MARKKQPPKIEVKEQEDLLTPDEVNNIMFNFREFSNQLNKGAFPGVLNPFLLNQKLQDVALNPIEATDAKLTEALKSPKQNEEILQGISEWFELTSQVYKRLISFLGNMLSFDLTMTAINADESDFGTVAYKKDLKSVENMLCRFDYQKEFNIITREMLRNDAFFGCPRFDSDQIVIQELPASPTYTKISGRWAYGFLCDFNMQYFIQPGVDINLYPPFFAEAYNELWGTGTKPYPEYIPSLSPEARGSSSWVYWKSLPVDVAWVWKFSPELATRLPFYTGMFSDLILQPLMRNLQKNVSMAEANKILIGEIPFLSGTAKVKDAISMSAETLSKFMQLVSSALNSSIRFTAAPLSGIQPVSFDGDNELYPSYLRNTLASSGVNTNLIFTSNTRVNQFESQASLNTDEQLMMSVYPQFNGFLNYNFNVGKKFKWKFELEGTNFFSNRAERLERQTALMQSGVILPQKISAAIGMKYIDFKSQLAEGRADGFVEKLTPILMANQMSGNETGGRPLSPDNKLGDAGAQSRESGTNNTTRKPKVT